MQDKLIRFIRLLLPTTLLCCCLVAGSAQEELPTDRLLRTLQPSADVNDFAGVLQPAEKEALEARCRQVREKTGAQLAVVVLKSLEGGQIDDFAVKLYKRWGIGQKGKDNGALLLVAIDDRKARVEVGYGLEPILPDALAGRVLTEQLFPAFRQQRYAEGLTAAVTRIAEIIERNEPAPAAMLGKGSMPLAALIFILAIFVAIGSFLMGAAIRAGQGSAIGFCLFFAGIPLLIGCLAALPWAPLVHIPLGLIAGWLGWASAGQDRGSRRKSDWGASAGPWWDSGWSGGTGSSGGGWSSGGAFSGGGSDWGGFGGGSSGGGGASGGW
jgi:uncharacterized protein